MRVMKKPFNLVAVAAGAATVVAPALVWAQAPSGDYGYGPHMMWGFGMIFGPLFLILLLAGVIVVAVLVIRGLTGPWQGVSHPQPPTRTPLDILKERFARGEIDQDEFEKRRRVLGD
jgi:putative membrane protein